MANTWGDSVERVRQALAEKGLAAPVGELFQSTRTAREAVTAVRCAIAEIAKPLVFRGTAIVSGASRVNDPGVTIDDRLSVFPLLWAASGSRFSGCEVTPPDLRRIAGGTAAEFAERSPA